MFHLIGLAMILYCSETLFLLYHQPKGERRRFFGQWFHVVFGLTTLMVGIMLLFTGSFPPPVSR